MQRSFRILLELCWLRLPLLMNMDTALRLEDTSDRRPQGWPQGWEDVACDLCGSANASQFLSGRDYLHGLPGEFTVVECRQCGLRWMNPRPPLAQLGELYPSTYGPHAKRPADEGNEPAKQEKGIKPLFWQLRALAE
jgi:hypothetical protein